MAGGARAGHPDPPDEDPQEPPIVLRHGELALVGGPDRGQQLRDGRIHAGRRPVGPVLCRKIGTETEEKRNNEAGRGVSTQ